MPAITHNKLVRDKISEIINSAGKQAVTRVLPDEEYLAELDRKLTEECAEYQADKSIEEMADVLEVLYAIAEARGYSVEELERVRAARAEKFYIQLRFWNKFVEYCNVESRENDLAFRKPYPQNWYDIPVSGADYHLSFSVTRSRDLSLHIYVY